MGRLPRRSVTAKGAKLQALGLGRATVITMSALLLFDSLLTAFIVYKVPYTKIDWDAYMSQVDGFLGGERNYSNLRGDTGPLVYPAGFLYVYTAIQYVTGGIVSNAQVVFGFLYILNLGIVLAVYLQAKVIPWWAFCLLCLSKRVHSIFVLRLFNDCIATTLAHFSILLFLKNRWNFGLAVFSVGVSVKMSVLLYAPPLLLLMFKALSLLDIAAALFIAAILQTFRYLFVVTACYVIVYNIGLSAFSASVYNFMKFFCNLSCGLVLPRHEHGLLPALNLRFKLQQIARLLSSTPNKLFGKGTQVMLEPKHIATVLFTGNFIGILCARSLHYQFYSWYFDSLPYLLWRTPFPTFLRLIIFGVIEACWNIYPSNSISSVVLLACHLTLLLGLWLGPCESPYAQPAVEKSE